MTRRLAVVKMSGAGNDFIVVGPSPPAWSRDAAWIRRVCRRRLSVGADGVLFVTAAGADRVRVEFSNPDGSAAFCGNGTRCAARYAFLEGLVGESMVLETSIGEVPTRVEGDRVRLELPPPRDLGARSHDVGERTLEGRLIDAGVPHFVAFVPALAAAPLERWAPLVRFHADHAPEGTNFNLVQELGRSELALRTWERGVEGETLACGSGAVAAAMVARIAGADEVLEVRPASGIPLEVGLPGPPESPRAAVVVGDARVVFRGELGADTAEGFPD